MSDTRSATSMGADKVASEHEYLIWFEVFDKIGCNLLFHINNSGLNLLYFNSEKVT
jgi:hypothetical protein